MVGRDYWWYAEVRRERVVARKQANLDAEQVRYLANKMEPEEEFMRRVIEFAKLAGWWVHHCRPAMTKHGWRTCVSGHVGWPDLFCCRSGEIVIMELKRVGGKESPDQRKWIDELVKTKAKCFVLTPTDWETIELVFK